MSKIVSIYYWVCCKWRPALPNNVEAEAISHIPQSGAGNLRSVSDRACGGCAPLEETIHLVSHTLGNASPCAKHCSRFFLWPGDKTALALPATYHPKLRMGVPSTLCSYSCKMWVNGICGSAQDPPWNFTHTTSTAHNEQTPWTHSKSQSGRSQGCNGGTAGHTPFLCAT